MNRFYDKMTGKRATSSLVMFKIDFTCITEQILQYGVESGGTGKQGISCAV